MIVGQLPSHMRKPRTCLLTCNSCENYEGQCLMLEGIASITPKTLWEKNLRRNILYIFSFMILYH